MPDTSCHLVFWQVRAQTGRVDFPQSFFYLWYYHSCLQIEDNLLVEDKQLLLLVHESADKNGNTKNKGKRLGKVLFVAQVHSLLSTCSSILSCIPRRRQCYPGGVGGQSRWAVPEEHIQIIEWNLWCGAGKLVSRCKLKKKSLWKKIIAVAIIICRHEW